MQHCDDAGHCSCISIASLGWEGVYGPCASDTTAAFQDWLNTQSTAHVDDYHVTEPTIDAQFLSQYDVLILQWMVDPLTVTKNTSTGATMSVSEGTPWSFSSDELTALQTWVNNGGGIIALTGYNCEGGTNTSCPAARVVDNVATNQMLASPLTAMQINSDDTFNAENGFCAGENCYCWGASLPLGNATTAIATPLTTTQATSIRARRRHLGRHADRDGRSGCRRVQRPLRPKVNDMTKVVVDANSGSTVFRSHQDIGKGHVFVYGDEWVTYTGEWNRTSACSDVDGRSCAGEKPNEVFQIPLFTVQLDRLCGDPASPASTSPASSSLKRPSLVYASRPMGRFTGFADADGKFFKALAKNQKREWFEARKHEFEDGWNQPMKDLLAEVRDAIDDAYAHCDLDEPKVFRIYRDVRFAKDKSPYKTWVAGCIPVKRIAKVRETPVALYMHFGTETAVAAGRLYMMEPASLGRYRTSVADDARGKELEQDPVEADEGRLIHGHDARRPPEEGPQGVRPGPPARGAPQARGPRGLLPRLAQKDPRVARAREVAREALREEDGAPRRVARVRDGLGARAARCTPSETSPPSPRLRPSRFSRTYPRGCSHRSGSPRLTRAPSWRGCRAPGRAGCCPRVDGAGIVVPVPPK